MTNQFPGYFISFEGIDGAGKSTHIDAFAYTQSPGLLGALIVGSGFV